jgi:hypothetical protein
VEVLSSIIGQSSVPARDVHSSTAGTTQRPTRTVSGPRNFRTGFTVGSNSNSS